MIHLFDESQTKLFGSSGKGWRLKCMYKFTQYPKQTFAFIFNFFPVLPSKRVGATGTETKKDSGIA